MKNFILTISSIFLYATVLAQSSFSEVFAEGEKFYKKGDYNKALTMFFKADSLSNNNKEVSYRIGKCYIQLKGKELSAIPFYEFALEMEKPPIEIYKDLGTLYHQTFLFDRAIEQFSLYIKKAEATDPNKNYCERMIQSCNNAKLAVAKKSSKIIQLLPSNINRGYSEYSPYISADLKTLIFTRIEQSETDENKFTKNFFISTSHNSGITWKNPVQINIPKKYNSAKIELAGLSFDGQTVYLAINEEKNTNLFSATIRDYTFEDISILDKNINSSYNEYSITFSADGTTCIFSSDRIGGFGGIDLYISTLKPDGTWSLPQNLGHNINTKYNENNPFLHPSGDRLIFASQGHKSIGGYDLFESHHKNGYWTQPTPIDYANTVYDDCYYMTDAKGSRAFFSQSVNFYPDRNKIYSVELSDNIPLTMLEGVIKAGNPPEPHPTQIKVFDNETKQKIKYVYCPNKYTGRYLMIFPPAKNYDVVIETEGFLPYLININIPEQKTFYELYQEIILENIEENNKKIGENIIVRNSFYDIYQTNVSDTLFNIFGENRNNKTEQIQLMKELISFTDSLLAENFSLTVLNTEIKKENNSKFDYLLDIIGSAIEKTDSLHLAIIDQNTLYDDVVSKPTYYKPDELENKLIMSVFENDTVYTAKPINTTENRRQQVPMINRPGDVELSQKQFTKRNIIFTDTIFFDTDSYEIEQIFYAKLRQIARKMQNNQKINAELLGYSDPKGTSGYNFVLSEKRAKSVLNFLSKMGVEDFRFIVIPCGIDRNVPTDNPEIDYHKVRRVEIKLFEIN